MAGPVSAHTLKTRRNNGITLIALIITIIIMLILVGVTITVAVNGGLFEHAGQAVGDTQNAVNAEQQLASGRVEIGGKVYESIDDYLAEKTTLLPYDETTKENGFLTANATYASDGYTAVIPKGFKISDVTEEQAIGTGLVIKDVNNNEFVWIPVTSDLESSYSYSSGYSEPTKLGDNYSGSSPAYDSQATLDSLYGENNYVYTRDFKYADEYEEMVEQVNKYNGFYIGRYETTIDDNGSIGSKYNTTVLTAGTTYTRNSTTYYYRWYGLYYAQKNANVTGNGTDVQTAMIYGVLWDKAMDFIRTQKAAGKTEYNVGSSTSFWHSGSGVVNSGQANPGATGDVALNIWDLESNAWEWTQEANSSGHRVLRGGDCHNSHSASDRINGNPTHDNTNYSSRVALYIK